MTSNRTVYLDNAASTFPKPFSVLRRTFAFIRENTSNPGRSGHYLSEAAAREIFSARVSASRFFGCSEAEIIFTLNATHAINYLFKGLLNKGDHIIISDMEHNAVLRPLTQMKADGISFDIADTRTDAVEGFDKLIRPNTKLIFCINASNVTGEILPIDSIAALAKSRGILFGTDASQSAGFLKYNINDSNIDFLCTSGHKGLMGIQGSGILIVKNEFPLKPLIVGGTGTGSLEAVQPTILPEALESGTPSTPAIISLGAGIEAVENNFSKRFEYERTLTRYAYNTLSEIKGVEMLSPAENTVPTLAFNMANMHSDTVCAHLNKDKICVRSGYHCAALAHKRLGTIKNGAVRISFSMFSNTEDIDILAHSLKKI